MKDYNEQIQAAITQANKVIETHVDTAEYFVLLVEPYLNSFDKLQTELMTDLEDAAQTEKDRYKDAITELLLKHQQVIEVTQQCKTDVSEALQSIHNRSKSLKKYINTFPHRVSLTDKKKG